MAEYKRILTLLLQGHSYRAVARMVGCSHRDVATATRAIQERGITLERLGGLTEVELGAWFPDGRSGVSADYDPPDFARVALKLRRNPHYTLLLAWRSYATTSSEKRKYAYSQYCHLFNEYAQAHDLVATLHHQPGRVMFVDWAGDTIPIQDAITGAITPAYVFVAVLPFSGLIFARVFANMRMEAWLDGHVGAFEAFGGATQLVVPDHALTATHQRERGDAARFLHERYRQLTDHYGAAVLPARVRTPRDKAAVESAVNTINMRILAPLLEEVWSNLPDVNAAVRELLIEINHGIRRVDGSTRFERFTEEEAATLAPLPALPFEQVTWKELKVGRNYHVTCDYQHYSVPFTLAGRSLRARLTSVAITLFDGERVVAEHARKVGRKGQYSTDPKHVPQAHQDVSALYSRSWFVNRANSIGPATTQVIEQLLDRYAIEAQSYLDCQNILGTLGKTRAKLEAASQQLLNMRGTPSYSTLKRLMASIDSEQRKPTPPRAAASTSKATTTATTPNDGVLVRDAAHYRDREA
jgi:transposase